MKLNPKTMSWQAPTTNVDGSPIDYELEYEVGLEDLDGFNPIVTIPGQLREDGKTYEAPIGDLSLDEGVHVIALRSFSKEDPERMSA